MNEKYILIKYEYNEQLIDVYFDVLNNTIWMSQDNIAKLLLKSKSTINEQINRLKNSDYHFENFDIKFGKTEFSRSKNHYSLDVITSLCKNNISNDFVLFKNWVNDNLKQLIDNQIVNENKYNIVVFNDENLSLEVNVDYFNETVWLTQEQIASLFQTERSVIVKHIKNIYLERELDLLSTCAKNAQVQLEGNRSNKIHDRFVIIDDIVYVFGSSLKDLGKKRTLVYKHKSITKEMLLN